MKHNETAYILASGSPRRKELLSYLDLAQTYNYVVDTEETIDEAWGPAEAVMRLSINKGIAVLASISDVQEKWLDGTKRVALISADTIVVCDDDILGKPTDQLEAFHMLSKLQGRSHQVYTGLTLIQSEHPLVLGKQNNTALADYAAHLHTKLHATLDEVVEKQSYGSIGEYILFDESNGLIPNQYVGYICSKVTFRPLTDEQIWTYINTGDPLDKAGSYGIQGIGAVNIESIEGDFYSVMGLPVSMLHYFISVST